MSFLEPVKKFVPAKRPLPWKVFGPHQSADPDCNDKVLEYFSVVDAGGGVLAVNLNEEDAKAIVEGVHKLNGIANTQRGAGIGAQAHGCDDIPF